jgi:hypothetical protein
MSEVPPPDDWVRELLSEIRALRKRINQVEDQVMRHSLTDRPTARPAEQAKPPQPAAPAKQGPAEPAAGSPAPPAPPAKPDKAHPPAVQPPLVPPPPPDVKKADAPQPTAVPTGKDWDELVVALTDSARRQGLAGPGRRSSGGRRGGRYKGRQDCGRGAGQSRRAD